MKKKIKNRNKELIIILTIFLILILFLTGYSIGRSYSKINVNGNTEIAEPILEVINDGRIDVNNISNYCEYEFIVKNYDEYGNITDIDLEYYIEMQNVIKEEAISIKVLKNGEEINFNENNRTDNFYLTKDEKQEDNYKIEIKYDKDKNINMEDIIETVQIKVHSEQKREAL